MCRLQMDLLIVHVLRQWPWGKLHICIVTLCQEAGMRQKDWLNNVPGCNSQVCQDIVVVYGYMLLVQDNGATCVLQNSVCVRVFTVNQRFHLRTDQQACCK